MLLGSALLFHPSVPIAAAEAIVGAWYAEPVERYGHFALGRPHEYARLVATTSSGRRLTLDLPENEVFEDLVPRLVTLAPTEVQLILTIVSRRSSGARLALVGLQDGKLAFGAQSAAIGTPRRWLNPVGVADLDGDGRTEIAAVITPHIGGPLKVYRLAGRDLVEIAALPGFSNHVYGTTELALSMPMPLGGGMRLLVPDATRMSLRIVELRKGNLVETASCAMSAEIIGPVEQVSPGRIAIGLVSGRQVMAPGDCRN
jgi:hypothetical protein